MIDLRRACLAILCMLLPLSGCSASYAQFVGKPAPSIRFTLMNGSQHALENLQGRKTVIAFWSTRCGACGDVLRKLNAMAASSRRGGPIIIAVNVDEAENITDVQELIRAERITSLTHAFSGNGYYDEAFMIFKVRSLPTVFVVNESGVVVAAGQSFSSVKEGLKEG